MDKLLTDNALRFATKTWIEAVQKYYENTPRHERKIMRVIILCLCCIIGCTSSSPSYISEYDYKYGNGYNAALSQFGDGSIEFINNDNQTVIKYSDAKSDTAYADGYHEALSIMRQKMIDSRNLSCPYSEN